MRSFVFILFFTLFSGFLLIFLAAAGGQATFGTTTFIIFDWWLLCCCCCDNKDVEAFDVFGGKLSVIHWSTEILSSLGPSLEKWEKYWILIRNWETSFYFHFMPRWVWELQKKLFYEKYFFKSRKKLLRFLLFRWKIFLVKLEMSGVVNDFYDSFKFTKQ